MNVTIYDTAFGVITQGKDSQCFLVDSRYDPDIPPDDGIMVADAGIKKGCYKATGNLFQRIPSDDVFPYQLLIQGGGNSNAIIIDNLNKGYIILSAMADGICIGSQTFETKYEEGDLRRFCARHNISPELPTVELKEYISPRGLSPFVENGERILKIKQKRTELIFMVIALLAALSGGFVFVSSYIDTMQLTAQREGIETHIAAMTANMPKGDIVTFEKLQRDDDILAYMNELAAFGRIPLASITADGAVFKSNRSLAELRQINPRIKPLQTDNFFLPVAAVRLPCEK